jgi:transposase
MDADLLQKENELLRKEIEKLSSRVSTLEIENLKLEEENKILKHLHYGATSEKITPEDKRTASLFNEAEDIAFGQNDENEIEKITETIEVKAHPRKVLNKNNAGRKPIDSSIPREVVEFDIPEEEKICACGTELKCIGEDVTERLKTYPVKVAALQERRKKYVCPGCEGLENEAEKGVITAEGIKHLIPGSIADESFLAWSISEKFEFALPFYRQAIRLKQIGVPIPRATLSNLTVSVGIKCEPIYKLLRPHIMSGPAINGDETRLQVLNEPERKNKLLSWMWVFLGGPPGKECVQYQYEETRNHETPYVFLKGYSGLFQSDDYEGYHTAIKRLKTETGIVVLHFLCWAHARRYFHRYWETTGKRDEEAKAILDLIKDLFELEDFRTQYSRKGFLKQRKNKAEQIFGALKQKLERLYPQTPSGLSFGKAIRYTLDNWEQLTTYVDHYELTPSNNAAERAIRPFVIGRKNWLFSGSPAGAKSSAILYSLIESAKLHDLKPFEYLNYIFKKIPYCQNDEDYAALLPFNVTPEQLQAGR